MRAVPSQAFVADHRVSPARFCLAVAIVAATMGAFVGFVLSKAPATEASAAGLMKVALVPISLLAALVAFCALLVVAAPVWWALHRLRLRGWASSLLAGALLVIALSSLPILAGQWAIQQSSVPLWVLPLAQAPFGLAFGWIIWRLAYQPAPRVADVFGPAERPAGESGKD